MLYNQFSVNEEGHLTVGGCDTVSLAEEYGTPLYVMDEEMLRQNCRIFRDSMKKYSGGNGKVLYASKALNCKALCRIVMEEGLGLDVVSGGELYTALSVGFPPEKIQFHGNNKTVSEIEMAIQNGVGRIIVDHLGELRLVNFEAAKLSKKVKVSLRIKPGIDAHTHDFIKTGQIDSKFGFALETGEALAAAKEASKYPNLELVGLHCHIGSQIFEADPFVLAAEVMMNFIVDLKKEGITISELNLGGGFGIKYVEGDRPLPFDYHRELVTEAIERICACNSILPPTLYIEPGRAIVGDAGITLYKIGAVKTIPGIRTYVSVDGGMGDNPRYALYKAPYTAVVANKAGEAAACEVTIAGRFCESGDLIQENTMIQNPEAGDTLAVFSTGAYNFSMASNYNRIPRPALILVKDHKVTIAVKRETYEDLMKNDI